MNDELIQTHEFIWVRKSAITIVWFHEGSGTLRYQTVNEKNEDYYVVHPDYEADFKLNILPQ